MSERWILVGIPVAIAWSTFIYSAGVYFGQDAAMMAVADLRADIRVLAEVVNAHSNIEVHDGAARRVAMDRELASLRDELNRLEGDVQRNHP